LLNVASALVRSGITVIFVANPFYERPVIATGSHFVAAGSFLDIFAALASNPRYLNPRHALKGVWCDLIAPSIRETYPVIRDTIHVTGATGVVSQFAALSRGWAAAAANVRGAIVTTGPSAWLSRYEPTVFGNWRAPRSFR
jgi:hypothetical protein